MILDAHRQFTSSKWVIPDAPASTLATATRHQPDAGGLVVVPSRR
jgi:hypothetical protein